jgi:hypothetical protein
LRFSREAFSHAVSLSSANPVGAQRFQGIDSATPVHALSRRFCSEIAAAPAKRACRWTSLLSNRRCRLYDGSSNFSEAGGGRRR